MSHGFILHEIWSSSRAILLVKTNRSKRWTNSKEGGDQFWLIPNTGTFFLRKSLGYLPGNSIISHYEGNHGPASPYHGYPGPTSTDSQGRISPQGSCRVAALSRDITREKSRYEHLLIIGNMDPKIIPNVSPEERWVSFVVPFCLNVGCSSRGFSPLPEIVELTGK